MKMIDLSDLRRFSKLENRCWLDCKPSDVKYLLDEYDKITELMDEYYKTRSVKLSLRVSELISYYKHRIRHED